MNFKQNLTTNSSTNSTAGNHRGRIRYFKNLRQDIDELNMTVPACSSVRKKSTTSRYSVPSANSTKPTVKSSYSFDEDLLMNFQAFNRVDSNTNNNENIPVENVIQNSSELKKENKNSVIVKKRPRGRPSKIIDQIQDPDNYNIIDTNPSTNNVNRSRSKSRNQKQKQQKHTGNDMKTETQNKKNPDMNLNNSDDESVKERVLVPSWRINPMKPRYRIEGTENMNALTYLKRHQKFENEEKQIKKWDIQRQKSKIERNKLLKEKQQLNTSVLSTNSCKLNNSINVKNKNQSENNDIKRKSSINPVEPPPVTDINDLVMSISNIENLQIQVVDSLDDIGEQLCQEVPKFEKNSDTMDTVADKENKLEKSIKKPTNSVRKRRNTSALIVKLNTQLTEQPPPPAPPIENKNSLNISVYDDLDSDYAMGADSYNSLNSSLNLFNNSLTSSSTSPSSACKVPSWNNRKRKRLNSKH